MDNTQIIYGIHTVRAAIVAASVKAVKLLVDRKRYERRERRIHDVVALAEQHALPIALVERDALDAKAGRQNHQGVLLLAHEGRSYRENDLDELLAAAGDCPLALVLDGVTDPHNLGACLRSAAAAGVHFVIAPKDRAASLNGVARKAASGAAEYLPLVRVTNLARTLKRLRDAGLWISGAAMQGEALYSADLNGPQALVVGGEGAGIRRLTREHCDQLVHIPMQAPMTSLNVSVATAIVLYEVVRQRRVSSEGEEGR